MNQFTEIDTVKKELKTFNKKRVFARIPFLNMK